jgi:hypothetical protein
MVESTLRPSGGGDRPYELVIALELPRWPERSRLARVEDGAELQYQYGDHMGSIRALTRCTDGAGVRAFSESPHRWEARFTGTLGCRPVVIRTLVQFSDRATFAFPLTLDNWEEIVAEHGARWLDYIRASTVETGHELVDACRLTGLYALRAQLTPWSIAPTLSERYWGGGAFHDEMYPFYALVSGNSPDLAARIPYFRLTTLPQAVARARGRGALYPWSSTEDGLERDPEGLWLTERFHLAQFAAEAWALWLYERRADDLAELYPVLKEIARFYEANVLDPRADGSARTIACVDFDESVGPVRNGPFTLSGAIAALTWAASAADALGVNALRAQTWRRLASGLRQSVYTTVEREAKGEVFGVPDGVALHYSILGHIFPFRTEVTTERARRSATLIHRICRSTRGWKPGLSEVYSGSNWIWTAGHLGIVHGMLLDQARAWESVVAGPQSCGPGMIPNEHVDSAGLVRVPWFTTGVGAWLYALHAMFAWVDECGTHLCSALPLSDRDVSFEGIRGANGVLLSGSSRAGRIERLAAQAPADTVWRYSLPSDVLGRVEPAGTAIGSSEGRTMFEVELAAERETEIACRTRA